MNNFSELFELFKNKKKFNFISDFSEKSQKANKV